MFVLSNLLAWLAKVQNVKNSKTKNMNFERTGTQTTACGFESCDIGIITCSSLRTDFAFEIPSLQHSHTRLRSYTQMT